MKENFSRAMQFVLPHECEFAHGHYGDLNFVVTENVPGDSGGLTKFGIDQSAHPHVDIRDLTLDSATEIYRAEEWTKCRCDDLPDGYDIAVFDIAVNMGMGTAIRLLQGALNTTTDAGLTVDGQIGEKTLEAARHAGQPGLARLLVERQKRYYAIVDDHPGDAKFLTGWLNRNHDLAAAVGIDQAA